MARTRIYLNSNKFSRLENQSSITAKYIRSNNDNKSILESRRQDTQESNKLMLLLLLVLLDNFLWFVFLYELLRSRSYTLLVRDVITNLLVQLAFTYEILLLWTRSQSLFFIHFKFNFYYDYFFISFSRKEKRNERKVVVFFLNFWVSLMEVQGITGFFFDN